MVLNFFCRTPPHTHTHQTGLFICCFTVWILAIIVLPLKQFRKFLACLVKLIVCSERLIRVCPFVFVVDILRQGLVQLRLASRMLVQPENDLDSDELLILLPPHLSAGIAGVHHHTWFVHSLGKTIVFVTFLFACCKVTLTKATYMFWLSSLFQSSLFLMQGQAAGV